MGSLGAIEAIVLILGGAVVFFAMFPLLLRWLWNMTMPDVFGLTEITFWQALRLMVISFLLFGVWGIG